MSIATIDGALPVIFPVVRRITSFPIRCSYQLIYGVNGAQNPEVGWWGWERADNAADLNDTGGNENDIGSPDTYFTRNVRRLLSESERRPLRQWPHNKIITICPHLRVFPCILQKEWGMTRNVAVWRAANVASSLAKQKLPFDRPISDFNIHLLFAGKPQRPNYYFKYSWAEVIKVSGACIARCEICTAWPSEC